MEKTREAQIAAVNAEYNKLNKKIKQLRGTIKVKKSKNEDTTQEESEVKELIQRLKTIVNVLNELRLPPGSTSGDKEPLNFILEIMSSSFEGLMSTSLGPLELLIQLVNFFVKLFIEFVKKLVNEIKRFVNLLFEQLKNLFPDIGTLYGAVNKIDKTSKTNQSLWYTIVDLLSSIIGALKVIFEKFSKLFKQFAAFIIKEVKFFAETLVTQLKKLFPDISTLYDAVSIIESTSKTNQSLWGSMVQLLVKLIDAFKNIFSNFVGMFSSRINTLDSNIKIFNDKVTELTKIANINKELVNTTKGNFNDAIGKIKEEFGKIKDALSKVSGQSVSLGGFGNVSLPTIDTSSIDTAIGELEGFVVSLENVENGVLNNPITQAAGNTASQAAAAAEAQAAAARQTAEAKAKADRQAAEAKAKADRQAAEAKAKADRQAAEAEAKRIIDDAEEALRIYESNPNKQTLDDLTAKLNLCDKCTGMDIFAPIIKEIETAPKIAELYKEYEIFSKLYTPMERMVWVDPPRPDMTAFLARLEWKEIDPRATAKLNEILKLMPACGNVCQFATGMKITTKLIKDKIGIINASNTLAYYESIPSEYEMVKRQGLYALRAVFAGCDACTSMGEFAPIIKEIETATKVEGLFGEYVNLATTLPPVDMSKEIEQRIDIGFGGRELTIDTTVKWKETDPAVTAKLNEILKLLPACGNVCRADIGKTITTKFIKDKIVAIDANNKLAYYTKIPSDYHSAKYYAKMALRAVLDGCGSNCPSNVKQSINSSGIYSSAETAARNAGSNAQNTGSNIVDDVKSKIGL